VPGFSYDSMGNVTADNLGNTYGYNAEGRQVSGSNGTTSNATIFDAFNRPVENNPEN
jgi:hypothetical protein